MGICKGFFKEFFVTKCRICGKKYWASTPINAKVCPNCCDELSKEMEDDRTPDWGALDRVFFKILEK